MVADRGTRCPGLATENHARRVLPSLAACGRPLWLTPRQVRIACGMWPGSRQMPAEIGRAVSPPGRPALVKRPLILSPAYGA